MMRISAVTLFIVAAATVAHADGGPDAQKKQDQKRADALFAEGRKLIDAHDDAGACAKFTEAIHLDPDAAGTMLNLGLCNEHLKNYKTALYWFRKAQVRAHESKLPEYESAAGEHTAQLAQLVATVKIDIKTQASDTRVKIDGEEVQAVDYAHAEVDPGNHTLEVGASGYKTSRQKFDVVDRGGQTLTVELVPGSDAVIVDPGATRRKIAIATGVAGGMMMVASGVLSYYWRTKYNDCIDSHQQPIVDMSGNYCAEAQAAASDPKYGGNRDSAARDIGNNYNKDASRYGTSLFVVGVAAVGIGTYLYLSAPQRERVDKTVFVPTVSPDLVGLTAVGQF